MLEHLTCEETIQMYARIAGIDENDIGNEVKRLLDTLLMKDCAKKRGGQVKVMVHVQHIHPDLRTMRYKR